MGKSLTRLFRQHFSNESKRKTPKVEKIILTKGRQLLDQKIKLEGKLKGRMEEFLRKLDNGLASCSISISTVPSHKDLIAEENKPPTTFEDLKEFRPTEATLSHSPQSITTEIARASAELNKMEIEREKAISNTDTTLYCYCKQVSWGDMIQCENKTCPRRWFHYSCVGLSASPKGKKYLLLFLFVGKWYCKDCQQGNK